MSDEPASNGLAHTSNGEAAPAKGRAFQTSENEGVGPQFGTFTGVFTPTLLTILGVIMYVRLGWVVGNGGLLGAMLVLMLAMGLTVCTGLSLSSIASNTRIGAGGPYAIINRSLGLEVGGSIGVPLYLSRPLGIAMYVFGFREGWLWIFPEHPPLVIDLVVFGLIFALAYLSTDLAFRVQFAIMGVIALSLVMIVFSPETFEAAEPVTWWGDFQGFPETGFTGITFWVVFAIFFPATTGILAGANMSGELKDPRRSIPRGTLWAIGVSSVIYFGLAVWATRVASPEELAGNYNFFIDAALWPPAVLAGLLGATFSSALAGAVGGPRIVMAMGQHRLMPKSRWLASRNKRGEPRNAVALTAVLTFLCLLTRDLNVIAPLVTMFFLITYFFINVVLFLESSLGLVSFRPALTIPRWVPLVGALGCIFSMFIISASFGLIAVIMVVGIYAWLQSRHLEQEDEDVRSGFFGAIAEWAANKVSERGAAFNLRAWKPNLMVPVEDPDEIRRESRFLLDVTRPEGSIKLLGLATHRSVQELRPPVESLGESLQAKGVFTSHSIVATEGFAAGVMTSLQALQSAFFRPNMLFLSLPENEERFAEVGSIIVQAHKTGVGVLLLGLHPKAGMGQTEHINLWVRPAPGTWSPSAAFAVNNLNLTLLMGHRLRQQWGADLNLLTAISRERDRAVAEAFLDAVSQRARIRAKCRVIVGGFDEAAAKAPQSDIAILGLQAKPDFEFMRKVIRLARSSCLFVADSGRESALV